MRRQGPRLSRYQIGRKKSTDRESEKKRVKERERETRNGRSSSKKKKNVHWFMCLFRK